MKKPRVSRCYYKNNGCERQDVNESVLKHMCEGSLFFKCEEYGRLNVNGTAVPKVLMKFINPFGENADEFRRKYGL